MKIHIPLLILLLLSILNAGYADEYDIDAIFEEKGGVSPSKAISADAFLDDSDASFSKAKSEFFWKHEYVPPSYNSNYDQPIDTHSSSTGGSRSGASQSRVSSKGTSSPKYGLFGSGGLRRIVKNGNLNGYMSYRVECNNGNERIVKNVGGWWSDATGHSFGDKYRGLSLDGFARKACGN